MTTTTAVNPMVPPTPGSAFTRMLLNCARGGPVHYLSKSNPQPRAPLAARVSLLYTHGITTQHALANVGVGPQGGGAPHNQLGARMSRAETKVMCTAIAGRLPHHVLVGGGT